MLCKRCTSRLLNPAGLATGLCPRCQRHQAKRASHGHRARWQRHGR